MNELLIVGVDPGNITAYAVLNLNEELVKLGSEIHFSQAKLIKKLLTLGKTFLISADVMPIPKYLKKLATLLGAQSIEPDYNLKYLEKTKIVDKFLKKLPERINIKNRHERDALAAVLIGYKKIRPLLKKIDDHLEITNNLHLKDKIQEMVLIEKIPISKALQKLT